MKRCLDDHRDGLKHNGGIAMTDKPSPIANLRALIALAGKATPAPWTLRREYYNRYWKVQLSPELAVCRTFGNSIADDADAAFISAARNAIPDMEAVCEENEAQAAVILQITQRSTAYARADAAESFLASARVKLIAAEARIAELDVVVEAFRERVLRAESALAAMRAALKPFAECADMFDPPEGDDAYHYGTTKITFGQCRRARAALATEEGKK